jgi:hypothetical protein
MRAALVLLVVLAWACGNPSPAPEKPRNVGTDVDAGVPATRPDVSCGTLTCGPDEYCEVRCTCCGMREPMPGEGGAEYFCNPLPDTCKTGNGPECQQRTVNSPCA